MELQLTRAYEIYASKATNIEKHLFLSALQRRDFALFFAFVARHLEAVHVLYTPVIGDVCLSFSHLFGERDGRDWLILNITQAGRLREVLSTVKKDVLAICVTDGGRILGLGDLGANGMGIPIGKVSLYTALAGVPPRACLPVLLDVGTDNVKTLEDPTYIGLRRKRTRGEDYFNFVDEFMQATQSIFNQPLVQFEDFGNEHAFELLQRYKDSYTVFNDDIQGTAAVVLGGLLSALRKSKGNLLTEWKFVLFGAGEAGLGIADLLVKAMEKTGAPREAALERIFLVDSKGLVVKDRTDLTKGKLPYAKSQQKMTRLVDVVNVVKPNVLIGSAAVGGAFDQAVLDAMCKNCERPVIFALSNPTVRSECTAAEAFRSSNGRAIFASGSPFPAIDGLVQGQCNNSYIFPGVTLGVAYARATRVPENVFIQAAETLSEMPIADNELFPSLNQIREVSLAIAVATARDIIDAGCHRLCPVPKDNAELKKAVEAFRYATATDSTAKL